MFDDLFMTVFEYTLTILVSYYIVYLLEIYGQHRFAAAAGVQLDYLALSCNPLLDPNPEMELRSLGRLDYINCRSSIFSSSIPSELGYNKSSLLAL